MVNIYIKKVCKKRDTAGDSEALKCKINEKLKEYFSYRKNRKSLLNPGLWLRYCFLIFPNLFCIR
ncbi:hypothetical protein C21_04273 [Arenibacter sp. NBRC 103722]|nr:hypothetical protein C21_04273 [Arenibacter sp. NBRC 103722]